MGIHFPFFISVETTGGSLSSIFSSCENTEIPIQDMTRMRSCFLIFISLGIRLKLFSYILIFVMLLSCFSFSTITANTYIYAVQFGYALLYSAYFRFMSLIEIL